ncbi:MAG: hypothetical protein K9N06_07135 [Candidatus Cloacimonetes bacterium]|nr:hypothetical protein [Candidatus Cloacimonadota bacterium]
MKKNLWIWLAAVFFAVLLWLQNVLLSEHEAVIYFPLRIDSQPADLVLSGNPNPRIGVTFKTKGINILVFQNLKAEYVVQGNQLEYGANSLHLSLKKLECSSRMREYITGFEQKVKLIQMDRIVSDMKPVVVNYLSREDEEYFQKNPFSKNSTMVEVKGASKILNNLSGIQTEKVNRKLLQNGEMSVRLLRPSPDIELLEDKIILTLSGESDIIKTISLVPIIYSQSAGYSISPQKVTVKVAGESAVLAGVTRDDIRIELVVGDNPDFASLKFTLPPGIKIQEYTPERVRIIH